MEIKITSPAFENGKPIPAKFTADGDDVSPILEWSPGPRGTVSYALIMDDPDAPRGTWVHWIAWNITDTRIKEDSRSLTEGRNSWNRVGYGGPAPPSGTHRYFFRIYALDTMLDLPDSTDVNALKKAMRGHVLAQGELMGTYSR
ncbi:MAG TPA: YbhB/YbcL family Raf kinase inhibitor-like protein [Phycisphaeraceae bacterium]|nr:YbhB/YbcL family Raf kinase inhibitor-like protein [Phycisphaeraceae bacterium]